MFGQRGVFPKPLKRIQFPCQRHLVMLAVDATMAQPADADAGLKFLLREVTFEVGSPVDFLWNQMMKGEGNRAPTAGAALVRCVLQLEAAGRADSIAARIFSLLGLSPLEK